MKFLISILVVWALFLKNTAQGSTTPIREYIKQTEKRYAIPKNLLYAIIQQESDFQVRAQTKDSHGLGQIKLETAKSFCNIYKKSQLYDYRKNIDCTATFMRYQLDRYDNNTRLAISAYNAGTPFICNGFVYKRDLGSRIQTLHRVRCRKKGTVANGDYVVGVMTKWRRVNKEEKDS